jgi:hypothetical protein
MQRVQKYVRALRVLTHGARHSEQHDRKENENTEYQTEGIEKVRIRRFGFGHG